METSAIGTLFTSVTEVTINIMTLLENVATSLLNNVIFQIVIGIVILGIIIKLIFNLIFHLKLKNGSYSIGDVKIQGYNNYKIRGKKINQKQFDDLFYKAEDEHNFSDNEIIGYLD